MEIKKRFEETYAKLAVRLVAAQDKEGAFPSLSSASTRDFSEAVPLTTTFVTSMVLHALAPLPLRDDITRCKTRAAAFLQAQLSENASVNYWPRESSWNKESPYPDDLDDTFCALAAMHRHSPDSLSGDYLAHAVTLLTALETQPGGPYRTWIVNADAKPVWQDVDLAVNANVAYFLKRQGAVLPGLTTLFDQAIRARAFISPYYPDEYAPLYFVSRAYSGTQQQQLQDHLHERLRPEISPLQTAFMILSLRALDVPGHTLQETAAALLECAETWNAEAFCLDPAREGTPMFNGAEALTIALCLEAVHACLEPEPDTIDTRVADRFRTWSVGLPHPLARLTSIASERILATPTGTQICQLPFVFDRILDTRRPITFLETLAEANLCGWTAYTIYDDFFDNEAVSLPSLAAANACLRRLTALFHETCSNPAFLKHFHRVMDKLDAANAWECTKARFEPGNLAAVGGLKIPLRHLADKSAGHALAALAVGYGQDETLSEKTAVRILTFFHSFLIARQLNDDLHDWETDLANGHATPVLVHLAAHATTKPAPETFWYETVPAFLTLGQHELTKAEHLASSFAQPEAALAILEPVRSVIEKTLSEQKKMLGFLRSYRKTA